jgi:hypothetical protein
MGNEGRNDTRNVPARQRRVRRVAAPRLTHLLRGIIPRKKHDSGFRRQLLLLFDEPLQTAAAA